MSEKFSATCEPGTEAFDYFSDQVRLLIGVLKFGTLLDRPMLEGVATPERIGLNELRILLSIAGEQCATGAHLARLLSIPRMNVSRALRILDDLGWLVEVPDTSNRRRRPYSLSDKGKQALLSMAPEFESIAAQVFADLTVAERIVLQSVLDKMSKRAVEWPWHSP
ncbi:MarR family transcriptional regulator [Aurantiacibacter xanthus]|uniref:MarR family transcriptional regulator n=1 Tax=Aurantiacibacter xanthus TaxID=1784712 RepID=A0A3A1NY60_9SPHN|nr:MarR family winged helix-turn-helix transcriptional regulator [Aurantiacibacter xanthus]RIV80074.1 MarR family transcriptional regulator [Aurantiacibacter xanthus]